MSTTPKKLLTPPSWLAAIGVAWLFVGLGTVTAYRPYQVLLCLLVWLPAAFYAWHERHELRKALLSRPGLAFMALSIWSAATLLWSATHDPFSTFREILYTWLTLIPIILLTRIEPDKLEQTLKLCVAPCAIIALVMLIDFFIIGGNALSNRLEGKTLINNPLEAGRYFATITIIFFTLLPKEKRTKKLYLASLSAMIAVIFFSQSRSVWGALALSVIIPMALKTHWRKLITFLAPVGGVLALVFIFYPDILLQRGLSGRPSIWLSGLQLWADHPLTGLGLGSEYVVTRSDGQTFQHTHNLLLHSGVTIGFVGLVLFSSLWLFSGWRLWKSSPEPIARCAFSWWIFASITFWVEGYNLWSKPGDTWLQIWPPIAIAIGLAGRQNSTLRIRRHYQDLVRYLEHREGRWWTLRNAAYGMAASLRSRKKSTPPLTCDILLIHPSKKSWRQGRKSFFIRSMLDNGLNVQEFVSLSDKESLKKRQLSRPLEPVPLSLYLPAARAAYICSTFKPGIIITERNGWPASTFLRSFSAPGTQTFHLAHGVICNQSSRLSYHDYDYYALFGKSSLEHLRKIDGFGSTSMVLAGPYFPLPKQHNANLDTKTILFLGAGPDEEQSKTYNESCNIALEWLKKNPDWSLRIRLHPRGSGHPWRDFSQQHNNITLCPMGETFDDSLTNITIAWCGYTNAILDCAVAEIPFVPLGSGEDFFQCNRYGIPKAESLQELEDIMSDLKKDWPAFKKRLESFSRFHIENPKLPIESLIISIKKAIKDSKNTQN